MKQDEEETDTKGHEEKKTRIKKEKTDMEEEGKDRQRRHI